MKAIILAAGEGKRLRPLTKEIPKCLVKLFGKSLLERQIKIFHELKINEIIVITGYKNEKIKEFKLNEYHNKNYDSTNMLETLFCAKNEFFDSIIISYGDIIFDKKVLQELIKSNENFAVIVDKKWKEYWLERMDDPTEDVESLKINQEGYITDIGKPVKNMEEVEGQYIGLMKFQNEGLEFIKIFYEKMKKQAQETGINPLNPNLAFEKSFMTDFIRGLINAQQKIKAITIENGWLELDTLEDFKKYNEMYENGKITNFIEV